MFLRTPFFIEYVTKLTELSLKKMKIQDDIVITLQLILHTLLQNILKYLCHFWQLCGCNSQQ